MREDAFHRRLPALVQAAFLALLALLLQPDASGATGQPDAASTRGEYLFRAGGCAGCHTDVEHGGRPLAGGRALRTPFGTFYGPNLTPDPVHGLGRWTEAEFRRALRQGRARDGGHYFPAFPYPAFTAMSDADVGDLWAYLRSLPPAPVSNRPHELKFPFGWRPLVRFWKALYFKAGPVQPDARLSAAANRGRYLVQAICHCGECHTPRGRLGGFQRGLYLAGTSSGPTGDAVPNITPDRKTGIGRWSEGDLAEFLRSGMEPDGDFAGGAMGEVITNATSHLTEADRRAIAAYLKTVPAVEHEGRKKKDG